MTRNLAAPMVTEVTADQLRPLVLVKFEFDSGDLRLWNGIRPLTYNAEVYTGAGTLLQISGIQETQQLKAAGVEFMLSGIDAGAISVAMAEDYQGRLVTLWFGALDENDLVVDSPFQQFQGVLDLMELTDDGGEAIIKVTAENDLVALERPRVRRNTDEDQELDYPGDRFFEFVPGLQEKEITL